MKMNVTMTRTKCDKFACIVQKILGVSPPSVRQVVRVFGILTATSPLNPYVQLFTKQLEIEKNKVWQELAILMIDR